MTAGPVDAGRVNARSGEGRVGRLVDLVATQGLRRGGGEILRKLRKRIYDRGEYTVLLKDLTPEAAGPVPATDRQFEAREAGADEIATLSAVVDDKGDARRREALYVSQGYRCVVCFADGEVVARCWWTDAGTAGSGVASRDRQVSFLDVKLEDGDAWCFRNEVAPSMRGSGTSTLALSAIEQAMSRAGYRRMFGYVDSWNIPARWLYELRGFKPVRTVVLRSFLSVFAVSDGDVFVRTSQRRTPTTFPYRRLRKRMPG
jgi:GNAT superfamily N-acetyltransferase